jgi:hypothetical protein
VIADAAGVFRFFRLHIVARRFGHLWAPQDADVIVCDVTVRHFAGAGRSQQCF